MLYLEGPLGSGKTTQIVKKVSHLLDTQPAASLLVLCSNHSRQQNLIETLLKQRPGPVAQLPIYTYAGFVRNALFNYWPLVEETLCRTLKSGEPRIRPELSGMEDSELLLKWLLARLRNEAAQNGQEPYKDFPGNDRHIMKQIIRRLRLRSENQLSRQDMSLRSQLLNEMCGPETAWLENQFDRQSYQLRVLDPNKQLDIFHTLLKQPSPMADWLKREIRHLVVDDVDETTAAQQRFIEFLAPTVDTLTLAADVDGGSRRGYLNAYPYDWQALKALRPGETLRCERTDTSYLAGQTLLENWKRTEAFQPLPPIVQTFDSFITRVEMMEQVVADVLSLIEQGYQPGDICLVLPKTDFLGFYQLQHRLYLQGIPVQLLSGTKRPSDNPRCKAFIYLLQWANSKAWNTKLSPWEVKTVLMQALQLDRVPGFGADQLEALALCLYEHACLHEKAEAQTLLLSPVDQLPFPLDAEAGRRYRLLSDWLEKAAHLPFDQQLYSAFLEILAPFSDERDTYSDLNRMIQSYLRQREIYDGFFNLKPANLSASTTSTQDEQKENSVDTLQQQASKKHSDATDTHSAQTPADVSQFNRWWLEQVKAGTVADTPEMPEAVHPDALVIGTPQKIIDLELYRKVQCWLDVGSREWARSDNAPLYNAWVHSAVWDGSTAAFTEEFNEAVIRTRAGHITRTLTLLATERIRAYASELDDLGFTQVGLLKPRLLTETEAPSDTQLERATLRPDQAPILDYQSGTLSISAVPGAGKTFVNVELLLELIERGIEPDNILVLTYMDSAAKTLLGRLKKKLAGHTRKLPVVSTIHSLAFRILTENDHAVLNGLLPDDMTILDDYGQGEILAKVALGTQPESTRNVNDWQRALGRALSHVKMFGVSEESIQEQIRRMPNNFRLAEFLPALRIYNRELQQNGSLDFTDLITQAVQILTTYPDIREKYQRQFQYIIEDEAQDSSRLLQTFIRLLGGETPNLIRTGDTNQSITTTFSSADTSVFREFIRNAAQRVHMDYSGRCAPQIIALANRWMTEAGKYPGLEQAFEPVDMRPIPGQNPDLLYAPAANLFDLDRMEEEWLLERIETIRQAQPDASIAVLVRTNSQVNRVAGMLQQAGIPAVSLSEQLNMHPVFGLILTYLQRLAEPGNMELQVKWHQQMVEAQLIPANEARADFLAATPLLYQDPGELFDEQLRQWYYDFLDFSRQAAGGNINTLIARLTDRFCQSVGDRSNGYLCALMAQDILDANQNLVHLSPLEIVIQQFSAFQRSWRGKKGFGEVLLQHAEQVVQVMSIHKSKGQEFDVVFMPFMQADSFPHEGDAIRFDESDKLIQELDRLHYQQAGKILSPTYPEDKKREKIEEEARLVYVGLTRARRALYLSAHRQTVTRYQKIRNVEPALAYRILAPLMEQISPQSPTAPTVTPIHAETSSSNLVPQTDHPETGIQNQKGSRLSAESNGPQDMKHGDIKPKNPTKDEPDTVVPLAEAQKKALDGTSGTEVTHGPLA